MDKKVQLQYQINKNIILEIKKSDFKQFLREKRDIIVKDLEKVIDNNSGTYLKYKEFICRKAQQELERKKENE